MARIKIEIDTESSNPISIQSRATSLPQGIGIVSSIGYDAKMTTAFNAGLGSLNPTQTVLDKLKFKTKKIQAAIVQLNNDTSIGLIATFGGNFTWNVAMQYATKPFISLVGGLLPNSPQPPSGQFAGAVSLDSWDTDSARITDLVQVKPRVNESDIWLLYDPRASMTPTELDNWTDGAMPATNGISDPTKFSLDFANIPNTAQAVVISAAPYFLQQREDLIKAANGTSFYMCYPLVRYRNTGGTQPTTGRATVLGPDLCEGATNAYELMGAMASTILSGQAPNPAVMHAPQRTIHL
jgi:hypothetical protein